MMCEQLAQCSGQESKPQPLDCKSNLTIMPLCHSNNTTAGCCLCYMQHTVHAIQDMHLLCIYCFFQIYVTTTKQEHFPLIIFVFVTANLSKLTYMKSVGMSNILLFSDDDVFELHQSQLLCSYTSAVMVSAQKLHLMLFVIYEYQFGNSF